MVTTVGIDPGTGSFDVVVLKNGGLIDAKSYPSSAVARDGYKEIVERVREYQPDLVIGPSGYGTPIICNEEITNPRLFAERILLLSGYTNDLSKNFVHGQEVYIGVIKIVEELWRSNLNTCYMPGVIHLRTVPNYKKINKIDMGTVDKLAASFYVTWYLGQNRDFKNINILVAELGYGYNAIISIENGKIIDGHGGTIVSNSLLSIGGLDAEVPSLLGSWSREFNYSGGVLSVCKASEISEVFSNEDEECQTIIDAMIDSIVKNIYALKRDTNKEIYLTGRLSKIEGIVNKLRTTGIRPFTLPTQIGVKEAAIGYALLGEGYERGIAKRLFEYMEIQEACGGTIDWVIHPRFEDVKRAFHNAVKQSVKKESWSKYVCE